MSKSLVAVILVLVAFGSVPASSQERPQRFTMTPTEGGDGQAPVDPDYAAWVDARRPTGAPSDESF